MYVIETRNSYVNKAGEKVVLRRLVENIHFGIMISSTEDPEKAKEFITKGGATNFMKKYNMRAPGYSVIKKPQKP